MDVLMLKPHSKTRLRTFPNHVFFAIMLCILHFQVLTLLHGTLRKTKGLKMVEKKGGKDHTMIKRKFSLICLPAFLQQRRNMGDCLKLSVSVICSVSFCLTKHLHLIYPSLSSMTKGGFMGRRPGSFSWFVYILYLQDFPLFVPVLFFLVFPSHELFTLHLICTTAETHQLSSFMFFSFVYFHPLCN